MTAKQIALHIALDYIQNEWEIKAITTKTKVIAFTRLSKSGVVPNSNRNVVKTKHTLDISRNVHIFLLN